MPLSCQSPTRRAPARLFLAAAMATALGALLTASSGSPPIRHEVERGRQIYLQHCASCHGPEGRGDGDAGAALPVRPADLTDGRVMNPLPDHVLARIIGEGGQAVGLSPLMPGWKAFLADRQIAQVIAYLRTLARPPFRPEEVLPVPGRREGPEQPIFFSHLIHAGSFRIDCQYCHSGARRGVAAGIPSVATCMGCHKIVAARGNPEVEKLHGYWQRKEPIPWVRIFRLPEFVHFPHKPHVRAGLRCQDCHGPVEAMERVHAETGPSVLHDLRGLAGLGGPPRPLSMGWCIECHREMNAAGARAPLDCMACHR